MLEEYSNTLGPVVRRFECQTIKFVSVDIKKQRAVVIENIAN
jgi:hypothetical protein